MKNWIFITRCLIIISTILFTFNKEICDLFYDPNFTIVIETSEGPKEISPWWQLRFKLKSFLRLLILLTVLINVDRKTRIVLLPFICLVFMDAKDRIVFNYTGIDVWDVVITFSLIFYAWYLYNKNGSRGQ